MSKEDIWGSETVEEPEEGTFQINALVTELGVNMGDHAQDVVKPVILNSEDTIYDVIKKHLVTSRWTRNGKGKPFDDTKYLTIRVATS